MALHHLNLLLIGLGVLATVLVSYGAAVLLMTALDCNWATIVAKLSHQRLVTIVIAFIIPIDIIGTRDIQWHHFNHHVVARAYLWSTRIDQLLQKLDVLFHLLFAILGIHDSTTEVWLQDHL